MLQEIVPGADIVLFLFNRVADRRQRGSEKNSGFVVAVSVLGGGNLLL